MKHGFTNITSKLSPIVTVETEKKLEKCGRTWRLWSTLFFYFKSIVHHEFLPQDHTKNKEYYLQDQRRLREAIWRKQFKWLLYHDNDNALLLRNFLAKSNTVKMPQSPYSPDNPCDFFLLPKIKRTLKGRPSFYNH